MLAPVEIDLSRCDGCRICVKLCPTNVFEMREGKAIAARDDACIGCDLCAGECPPRAITVHRLAMPATNEEVQLRWAGMEPLPAPAPAAPRPSRAEARGTVAVAPSTKDVGAGLGYVPTPSDLPRPPGEEARQPARPAATVAEPPRPLQVEG